MKHLVACQDGYAGKVAVWKEGRYEASAVLVDQNGQGTGGETLTRLITSIRYP